MANQTTTTEASVAWPRDEIIKEAKRIEESTLLSSKAHFAAANRWGWFHLVVGVSISILAAVAAAFTFSSILPLFVGGIALAVTVLSAITTFLNPNERSTKHLNAGNGYASLCDRARIFWTIDVWSGANATSLTEAVRQLSAEKSRLSNDAPQISPWAYRTAKKGVAAGEGSYAVDQPHPPSSNGDASSS
jgi:hypothetical protein